ncbi:VPLPA-CTERM protein sorting domain-containing protein [Paucidesulfovibrio gracilis DSM 16080]|uniref:VPLPA-CTERM protein sorting domain-containing protein n=1 Tax=Paucidesulfovibrio gracilis DSM 16080 TaxID=1121449 RepID=A0A1T4XWD5_9BACT|nr:hypothetical protein [Paucidesulfovibrio gracilis]SKA93820.1 VPLPA-CTERM protein sorting domain-containing protein [Paucidesulfovibrio gracilis DSM 16080]
MIRKFTAFILLAMLSLAALPAQAELWTFEDQYTHWNGWGTHHENKKDVIGIPDFTDGTATVVNNTLQSVRFFFSAGSSESLYNQLGSGDLFVNTDNDSSWNYLVRLNNDLTADVYNFNTSYTDRGAYYLGHADGDYRDYHPAWGKVWGDALYSGTWSGKPEFPGEGNVGVISIAGLNIDFDKLSLSYTVSCANDIMGADTFSKTPIPGAVWLLGSGLLGLIGLRRRQKG